MWYFPRCKSDFSWYRFAWPVLAALSFHHPLSHIPGSMCKYAKPFGGGVLPEQEAELLSSSVFISNYIARLLRLMELPSWKFMNPLLALQLPSIFFGLQTQLADFPPFARGGEMLCRFINSCLYFRFGPIGLVLYYQFDISTVYQLKIDLLLCRQL